VQNIANKKIIDKIFINIIIQSFLHLFLENSLTNKVIIPIIRHIGSKNKQTKRIDPDKIPIIASFSNIIIINDSNNIKINVNIAAIEDIIKILSVLFNIKESYHNY